MCSACSLPVMVMTELANPTESRLNIPADCRVWSSRVCVRVWCAADSASQAEREHRYPALLHRSLCPRSLRDRWSSGDHVAHIPAGHGGGRGFVGRRGGGDTADA
jgi:hypothetical protein